MLKKLGKLITEKVMKDIVYKLDNIERKCYVIDKKLEKVNNKLDKIIGDDKGDEK